MTTPEHKNHAAAGQSANPARQPDRGPDNSEDLKKELLNGINSQRRAPLSWGSVTVSAVLGLLAVLSIAQTAQSVSLYNQLKSGDLKSAASPAGGAAPSLPNQVGGC